MSYGETTGQPRSGNKPGLFPLMIMAFMAFYLFLQYEGESRLPVDSQLPGGSAEPGASSSSVPEIVIPDISNDGPRPGGGAPPAVPEWASPREASSDWAIDTDIPTAANEQSRQVNRGDWSLEIGESSSAADAGGTERKSPQSKSTTKGDWEISEVDPP